MIVSTREQNHVEIYTDGACSGNPGPGGYGVILKYKAHEKEFSGAYRLTTNNRMEILAAIVGLEKLTRPCNITLYSDSQYLVDAMTKGWARSWRNNNWKLKSKGRAKNIDLWQKLLQLAEKHQIKWVWVRGHADNPYNNRCDKLATGAILEQEQQEDTGYLKEASGEESLFR